MENFNGIEYKKPKVYLIQETGLGSAELAARTCYDSFDKSENREIIKVNELLKESPDPHDNEVNDWLCDCNNIDESKLLGDLAWTYFHHSILEHANLSFLIKGTSRGSLQEHARHRIQAISVRSTRYTMSTVINAYVVAFVKSSYAFFEDKMFSFDMFVTTDEEYNKIQIKDIWNKLEYQRKQIGEKEFLKISIAKSIYDDFFKIGYDRDEEAYELLCSKSKRNVGDSFKHIVNDNWKVDMVVTFNLRSLKNYFDLRDSGAAYFQIQWLAQEMKKVTPKKYLKLIDKKEK